MSIVVGLTGGIGSGKSTVANLFAALGAAIVDTDAIAHELTAAGGAALPPIVGTFGTDVLSADGALDRARMRQLVFADRLAKYRLEAILHPLIRARSAARCQQALQGSAPYVILVVPLLVESVGYRERVDRVLVVDCAEETQIARVIARSGLAAAEVRAIMATQATRAERIKAADDVIVNEGDPQALATHVAALHAGYLNQAAGTAPDLY